VLVAERGVPWAQKGANIVSLADAPREPTLHAATLIDGGWARSVEQALASTSHIPAPHLQVAPWRP